MMLHPRHQKRQLALSEMQLSLLDIIKKYDLRFSEILSILNRISSDWIGHLQKEENKHYKKTDKKDEQQNL